MSAGEAFMLQPDVVQLLSQIDVFNQLSNEELGLLSQYFQKVPFRTSDTIVHEGAEGTGFYIVTRGTLKVFLPQEIAGGVATRVSALKLNVLRRGDCFGEYSMIDKSPASASIGALTDGELMRITEADFDHLLATHDRIAKIFYRNVLYILIKRLRMREKEYDLLLVVPD
jgi:CRP/FNR family cyclic AMP-dependent transcriptional regulator